MDGKTENQDQVQPQTTSVPSDLEGKTNKELQDELVNLGMPAEEADKIKTSSVLISVINTLRANKTVQNPAQPELDPREEKLVEKNWRAKTKKQWAFWDSSPKVSILVPLSGKEKQGVIRWVFDKGLGREVPVHVDGAIQPVTENGAQYLIPKGVYIEVPSPVAKIIQDKFRQTSEAGRNIRADRMDPETGHPVSDRL